jgi:hypothetical protein
MHGDCSLTDRLTGPIQVAVGIFNSGLGEPMHCVVFHGRQSPESFEGSNDSLV